VEVITAHHFTPLHMKLAMQSNMPLNSQNWLIIPNVTMLYL
jgi:hypothetical protein